ncbi:hypothetical protein BKA62DRAFT_113033 [Auriculariales sp. MPI-PUGE-AT-0066]|nr:hypothetical protein BKA62DRAFT_113033 [Auriculariales sp. MPI-PUGE-AT-0066]
MSSASSSNYDDIDLPLPRGEACLVCRRRKVRCDGARPKCGTCTRSNLQNTCEYHDTRYIDTIRRLEGQVSTLQNRLEGMQTGSPTNHGSPASSNPDSPDGSPDGVVPSPQALETILSIFIHHRDQFGIPSSVSATSLRNGQTALLEAACAIACHFAPENLSFLGTFVTGFRMRAERALGSITTNSHPSATLARIQAHSLLATLSLVKGSMLDGARHAGAAWQLAVAMRLHALEGPAVSPEQAETWWMVYRLDRAWSVVLDIAPGTPADTGVRTMFLPRDPSVAPPPHLQMLPSPTDMAFDPLRETTTSYLTKVISLYSASHQILGGNTVALTSMAVRLEQFLRCSTIAPTQHATARIISLCTLFQIRLAQEDVVQAIGAARSLAEVLGSIPEPGYNLLHPVVAHSVQKVCNRLQQTQGAAAALAPQARAMLGLATQRLSQAFPYVTSRD